MTATEPGAIPVRASAIDPAWLGEALSARYPGVCVAEVEIERCTQATNAHARLYVRYAEDSEPGRDGGAFSAPERIFCKLLPEDEPRREAIAATGMGVREALFYQRLAPTLELRVPEAHVVRLDESRGDFVLLLEDLVASGAAISDGTVSVAPDPAARALENLARMHVRLEDPIRRRNEAGWVREPDPPSDYGAVRLREALARHRDRLTGAFAEMAELYVDRQEALHAVWHDGPDGGDGPITVIHGDPHIGNLFEDGSRIGFLDWGLVTLSRPLRDVSYFLQMALSVEDRRRHERDLIRHYLDARAGHGGQPIGFDEAWRRYRLLASYLVPACCQIVTFPDDISPARRTFSEAFLARAEAAVEDLEVRAALRRHAEL